MRFLPCLLVVVATIVQGAEYATTTVPGGIEDSPITTFASVDNEDRLLRMFKESASSTLNPTTVEDDSTTIAEGSSSTTSAPRSVSEKMGKNIQAVPRRRVSTLAPVSRMTSPAALRDQKLVRGWISDEIADALYAFAPQPKNNPKCTYHGQLFRESINNYTLWAMQMLDATNRIPSGVLSGSVFQLGHFDQCVKISLPAEDMDGRYCLSTIKYAPTQEAYPGWYTPNPSPKFNQPDAYENAWEMLKPSKDLSRRARDEMQWAVCVPSSCTTEDVKEALVEALKERLAAHGIDVDISLPDNKCYAKREEQPYSLGAYVVVGILVVIYFIVAFATFMDMFYYQSDRPHSKVIRKWMKPFSAYTNLSKVTTANTNKEFVEFHFLKLFAIGCVISGHRQMSLHGAAPNENPWWLEWSYSQFLIAFSINGGVLVDTFFLLSGFLTCHYIYKELVKRKRLNLFVIIVNRWIRIAPVYMIVMGFYGWVLPYAGDGPMWKSKIDVESSRCVNSWWVNLLFINNYVNVEEQCMVQSWYLACDMHFFILGSLLVYALWKWPRGGQVLMWLSFLVSLIIPGYITYKNKYWGVVLHYNSLFVDPVSTEQFRTIYMPSHNRAGPYIVGIIGAYLYQKLEKKNFKFPVSVMIIGSIIAATLSVGSIMSGYIFYLRDRPYNIVESVLYAATHRSIWAIGIMWYILAEATTGYGILYNVCKHPFFTAFGRLTYCAYLVHMIPQLIHLCSSRLPIYLDFKRMFWYTMGDIFMTYCLAIALNLLFEAPLERLQKKIIKKLLRDYDNKNANLKKHNGELNEIGNDNKAMDKSDMV